jgi:hypothetical protein
MQYTPWTVWINQAIVYYFSTRQGYDHSTILKKKIEKNRKNKSASTLL